MKKNLNKSDIDNLAFILAKTQNDPYLFVQVAFSWGADELKEHSILDWQKDILISIRDNLINVNQAIQIAVASGHGIGKSALVSWLILWALSTMPHCKGIVTANTESQLKSKTWAELSKWHRLSIVKDLFTVTKTAIYSSDSSAENTWRIDAIAWSEHRPEAFAGLHNQNNRILIIFDEASAIPACIWEVAEGALTDENTQILFFAFGNPTRPDGRFFECFGKYRHRWNTRKIDSRTVSITNKEQINKWVADYGLESDFVKVRVLGEFPSGADDSLIKLDTVKQAEKRCIINDMYREAPKVLGVDVARFGSDKTVIAFRQGLKLHKIEKYSELDTMQTADRVIKAIMQYEPEAVFIDVGGVGAGVYDYLRSIGYNVTSVDFGGKSSEPNKYFNKRSEMWCKMADWLESADIVEDDDLRADLIAPSYYFKGDNGQILLERKQDIKKRGLASPDSADAIALTFASNIVKNRVNRLPSVKLR